MNNRNADTILRLFFERASADFRINKSHLAVFVAILHMWQQKGYPYCLVAFGKDIMVAAKISSDSTYHRIIGELHKYGYIRYKPSFYKGTGSVIELEIERK